MCSSDLVVALRDRGCDLTILLDSVEAARAVAARGVVLPALIEIDSDGHRAGVADVLPHRRPAVRQADDVPADAQKAAAEDLLPGDEAFLEIVARQGGGGPTGP